MSRIKSCLFNHLDLELDACLNKDMVLGFQADWVFQSEEQSNTRTAGLLVHGTLNRPLNIL